MYFRFPWHIVVLKLFRLEAKRATYRSPSNILFNTLPSGDISSVELTVVLKIGFGTKMWQKLFLSERESFNSFYVQDEQVSVLQDI